MPMLRLRSAAFVAALALAAYSAPLVVVGEASALAAPKKKKKKAPAKKKPKKKTETPIDVGDIDEPAATPPSGSASASGSVSGSAAGTTAGTSSGAGTTDSSTESGTEEQSDSDGAAAAATSLDEGRRLRAELLLGYGISSVACGASSCNPYGFGLGVRAGYKLPKGFWLGGSLGFHVGYSTAVQEGVNPYKTNYGGSVFWFGPEGGYELPAGPVMLRPFLGLGMAAYGESVKDDAGPDAGIDRGKSGARFVVWPGVAGTYSFSPLVYAGLDVRGMLMVDGASAFAFYGMGGLRFDL